MVEGDGNVFPLFELRKTVGKKGEIVEEECGAEEGPCSCLSFFFYIAIVSQSQQRHSTIAWKAADGGRRIFKRCSAQNVQPQRYNGRSCISATPVRRVVVIDRKAAKPEHPRALLNAQGGVRGSTHRQENRRKGHVTKRSRSEQCQQASISTFGCPLYPENNIHCNAIATPSERRAGSATAKSNRKLLADQPPHA